MSELKARTARSIAEAEEILELGADCPIEQAQVYLKEEADKAIAHSKYKRCVAKAEACMHKRWRTDEGFDYARSTRHMKKWLELAEKFKEKK